MRSEWKRERCGAWKVIFFCLEFIFRSGCFVYLLRNEYSSKKSKIFDSKLSCSTVNFVIFLAIFSLYFYV